MTATTLKPGDYKVADLSLAEYGRNEIRLAQHEMPGFSQHEMPGGDSEQRREKSEYRQPARRIALDEREPGDIGERDNPDGLIEQRADSKG